MVDELLDLVNVGDKRDANVQEMSRGMQQRLCLAHALVHDPQILLLDEPASGLDPRARVEMRELLKELTAMGKTIIVSSHILAELAEMCTQVGIIEKGKLVACGTLLDIRRELQASRTLRVRMLADETRALALLRSVLAMSEGGPAPSAAGEPVVIADYSHLGATLEVQLAGDDRAVAALLAKLVSSGAPLVDFHEATSTLEELFLQLTEPEHA